MAASTSYFNRLNIKQIEMLARRRQENGAHAYYTQVYDPNRVYAKIGLPGYLSNRTTFTVLYEYTRPFEERTHWGWAIHLGKLPTKPISSLSISGAYRVLHNWEGKTLEKRDNPFDKNTIKGFHVLEFTMEDSSIVAFVDGEQIVPKGMVVGREKDFTNFIVWDSGNEPYALWEAHFTASNQAVQFNLAYGFPHFGFKLQAWGYVEFSGSWKDTAQIKEGNRELAELRTRGKALLKLKVYPTQVTTSNELDKAGPVNVFRRTEVDLGKLTCSPSSALYNITVVVGDYGK